MKNAIELEGIFKSYGKKEALKGISFEVKEGELFGLIGPDGAGKTSLIRILCTLLLADKGEARVLGFDVRKDFPKLREKIGYMPGRFSLYQDLSVQENMRLFATIFGTTLEANYNLVREIYSQLEPFKHRRAGKLSGGMKQKLALSCALIHRPEILFLDEPTTGVDPVSRKEFWGMLKRLKDQGISILVSTPYMDEASLCDRVGLIQEGQMLSIDTPAGICGQFPKPLFSIKGPGRYSLLRSLREYEFATSVFSFGESIHYTDKRAEITPEILLNYLREQGHEGVRVELMAPEIEDCFMELMQVESEDKRGGKFEKAEPKGALLENR